MKIYTMRLCDVTSFVGMFRLQFRETIANIEKMALSVENNCFSIFEPAIDGPSEEIIRKFLAHMKSQSITVTENEFRKMFQLIAIPTL